MSTATPISDAGIAKALTLNEARRIASNSPSCQRCLHRAAEGIGFGAGAPFIWANEASPSASGRYSHSRHLSLLAGA